MVVRVQQMPFCWDLIMSQRLDAQGNIVGPYERDDLRTFWYPKKKIKGHRRKKLRDLHYNLIWEITEMQVKVYVQAIFPNQVGSPLSQLAKEQALAPDDKTVTGESRSKALDKDIEITNGANEEHDENDDEDTSEDERRDIPRKTCALARSQQVNGHPRQHQRSGAETSSSNFGVHQQRSLARESRVISGQEQGRAVDHRTTPDEVQERIQPPLNSAPSGILRQSAISQGLPQPSAEASPWSNSRTDGRRRDGK
jgi:hypothetical protein